MLVAGPGVAVAMMVVASGVAVATMARAQSSDHDEVKVLAAILAVLLVAIQYPLWIGKGGWMRVRELDRQVVAQHEANAKLRARNDALEADVRDLKQGFDAVEERARFELGMIKKDEIFYQLVVPKK
jgi:cell division protein FtsB